MFATVGGAPQRPPYVHRVVGVVAAARLGGKGKGNQWMKGGVYCQKAAAAPVGWRRQKLPSASRGGGGRRPAAGLTEATEEARA